MKVHYEISNPRKIQGIATAEAKQVTFLGPAEKGRGPFPYFWRINSDKL